jgi:glycosyltransferase involved in cell wall biosynthesis
MKLISIIVPAFNEEKNVIGTFEAIKNSLINIPDQFEIIFVDDCSTDKTNIILTELAKKNTYIKIVTNKQNLGYGGAFLQGAKISVGKYLQLIPGDDCFTSHELKKIVDELSNNYDWILADTKDLNNSRTFGRELFSRFFVWTINILFLKHFRYYNGIHVVKREIFNEFTINSRGPLLHTEMFLKTLKKTQNYKIVRAYFVERTEGSSKIFNIKTILKTIYELIYLRIELWRK